MPSMIPPVDAPITQYFGANATAGVTPDWNGTVVQQLVAQYGNYQPYGHDAEDYGAPMRTPVRAPAAGTIDFSGNAVDIPYHVALKYAFPTHGPDNWPSGLIVCMDHGDGFGSYSAHLDQTDVDHLIGQWVEQGRHLGLSGSSGRSGGPHVHFSVIQFSMAYANGLYGRVNPRQFMTGGVVPVGNTTPGRELLIPGIPDLYK